jgi:hypothetical protein
VGCLRKRSLRGNVAKHFILLYVVIVKELNRLGESHYVKISNRTIVGSPFYAAAH